MKPFSSTQLVTFGMGTRVVLQRKRGGGFVLGSLRHRRAQKGASGLKGKSSPVNPCLENIICAERNAEKESEAEKEGRAIWEHAHSLSADLE